MAHRKVTYFLGAGFSVPINLPVMSNFFQFAEESKRLSEIEKAYLRDLIYQTRAANAFLQSSYNNIEDALSFELMGRRVNIRGQSLDPGANIQETSLEHILQRIYSTLENAGDFVSVAGAAGEFINPKHAARTTAIITTNYDLLTEMAFKKIGLAADYGFKYSSYLDDEYSQVSSDDALDTGPSKIPVLKLHGSVNWFHDGDWEAIKVERRIVAVGSFKDQHLVPFAMAGNFVPKMSPVIVPPSFLKPDLSRTLNQIWSQAAKHISESTHIVFVGYSFPASDVEMKYFLARALTENTFLRKIMIVSPEATQIVERLQHAQSGMGRHFCEMLEPIPQPWGTQTSRTLEKLLA